ncbi:efflux transporter outer membrane subunit [Burkholderia gladioli]|uniref:efflux transporter outer membrane subunit n=1 Tax=Burkholderia gladioli TaxID=28095 RepID=UPI0016401820|nr:efflux transporter outer membrane subunit [Burkholderia gladioli]
MGAVGAALLAIAVSGCMLGPDYHAPDVRAMNLPSGWTAPAGAVATDDTLASLVAWWRRFRDPQLDALVAAAQRGSPTLAIALARIDGARASVRQSRSALLPTLNGTLAGSRSNFSEFIDESPSFSSVGQNVDGEVNRVSAGLDAAWRLDLFGAARRGAQASAAQLASQQARFEAARITLAGDVSTAYVAYRECEADLDYLSQALRIGEHIRTLIEQKARAGFVAPLDARFAEGNVASSRERLAAQTSRCARRFDQIVYLTGSDRELLKADLAAGRGRVPAVDPADAAEPLAIDASLLAERPDVRAAERQLAAANARIGVAIGQRFPSLGLSGQLASTHYYALGQTLSLSPWTLGASLVLPVFDGGAGAARVASARAQYEEASATYEQVVQLASRDIEDALATTRASDERVRAARQAVDDNTAYFHASETSHDLGALSLIDLESARQRLVSSQQDAVAAESDSARAWISLYSALGGGWPARAHASGGGTP